MDDEKDTAMGQVIRIDEARIRDHLGEMVRGTVEDALNGRSSATRTMSGSPSRKAGVYPRSASSTGKVAGGGGAPTTGRSGAVWIGVEGVDAVQAPSTSAPPRTTSPARTRDAPVLDVLFSTMTATLSPRRTLTRPAPVGAEANRRPRRGQACGQREAGL